MRNKRFDVAKKHYFNDGFTLVELVITIVVIGLLAIISIVSYNGVKSNAIDVGVRSDLDSLDGIESQYGLANGVVGKSWYSGSGADSDLKFTPSPGNVIDIVIGGTDYCIRGYNTKGNKNSITNAFTKESSPGACGTLAPSSIALNDVTPTTWTQISAGQQFACGIANNLRLYCWGLNSSGQLGNNSTTNSSVPIAVDMSGALSGKTISSLSTGADSVCVVASDNRAYCWGDNSSGELGIGTKVDSLVPVAVTMSGGLSGKTISSISVGATTVCAISSDAMPYCWGDNTFGQIGNNTWTESLVPTAVYAGGALAGKTVQSITSANNRGCVIASDDLGYCWGGANVGQLGNNIFNSTPYNYPVAVYMGGALSGKILGSLSKGVDSHSCTVASDSKAYCWGYNTSGQLGINSTTNIAAAAAVSTAGVLAGKTIQSVSTGSNNSCALASDSQVYCWGDNSAGQLGNNSFVDSQVPVAVDTSGALNGKLVLASTSGSNTSCVLANNNEAYCWGRNSSGELGNNSTTDSKVPVLVANP
jgi:prepilin-type N-terminal cleavage/methylation domain-containing protein